MKHLTAFLLASAAVLAACDEKQVDCAKLSTHIADVSTRDVQPQLKEELHRRIRTVNDAACRDGSFKPKELECMGKAQSEADVGRCVGL